jgi:hypothetical protein
METRITKYSFPNRLSTELHNHQFQAGGWMSIVKAGFGVDNGLDQLEQCPAFMYANNLSQYTWFKESNKVSNKESGLVARVD